MARRHAQRPTLKIYSESEGSFFQMPSNRAMAISHYLRSDGVDARCPMAIIMGIHRLELPSNADLKAVQLLIDQWAKDQIPHAPAEEPERGGRARSRTTMFGKA